MKLRVSSVLLASLGISACADQFIDDTSAKVATMKGDWLVTAIDDELVLDGNGNAAPLIITASDEVFRWEPSCAQLMFLYRLEGSDFRADQIRYDVPYDEPYYHPSEYMPPPCAIALPPKLKDAMAVMATAREIEFTADGGFRLRSDEHNLTLRQR
ncbi:hypothetical protein [Novosphingopyxis sp. YJ-S2-01]|uniref:hypothetical protein n=1 Tax=Novosphingopyxis sp. YJ-S2-01 TaxID=2794021 RepID=UPI0018DD423C|nr:hypothetical protein [Novosphingopyxis sp. YJ-S2-01]MBH9537982.1 hypothetical protein [Novosphingopyxis sp. YJ-S2-01]